MDKMWYLAQINLFSDLPKSDLEAIGDLTPMSSVGKGTLITTPFDEHRVLYLLKKGKVRIYKINPQGKQFTLGFLSGGNVFGEVETLSTGTRNVFVEAVDDTLLCVLSKPDLERMLRQRPELALKLLELLSERVREMEDFLETMALSDVKTRLVYLLVKLARTFSIRGGEFAEIELRLSHQELAEMDGSTRETVTLMLADLSRSEIVKARRRKIAVHQVRAAEFLEADAQ